MAGQRAAEAALLPPRLDGDGADQHQGRDPPVVAGQLHRPALEGSDQPAIIVGDPERIVRNRLHALTQPIGCSPASVRTGRRVEQRLDLRFGEIGERRESDVRR